MSTSCIHTAFFESARADPERALLVDRNSFLTQRQLVDAIDRRCRDLLTRCGGPDHIVAVQLQPSIETVVTYFACLASGLRYLPLPLGPPPLVARLLHSLAPRVLVTQNDAASASAGEQSLLIVDSGRFEASESSQSFALPKPDPERIAHLLPTSGTETGTPKVVMTDHVGSMLSHDWRSRLWSYDPAREVVGCNLFGIWDVVPALIHGIPAVMIDDATMRDPFALASTIVRYGITRIMLTPTLLDACLACEDGIDALRRLRRIVLCGETVTTAQMERAWEALPRVCIANLYSISECHDVAAGELRRGSRITNGRIADFAEVHITDPNNRYRLLRAGEPGRVLIGGAALAAGYLDRRLTEERFFELSLATGQVPRRVYDSGDLGVLCEDGTLEILGRVDGTRKVRGAWAEPASIATVLLDHPAVARANVVDETDGRGRTQLSAFVVARTGKGHELEASLRSWLEERVAPQSVPSRFVFVDDLPLMSSGKIDLGRLREMSVQLELPKLRPSAALLETAVLATFQEVLERTDAGLDDDLRALGADSLAMIVICGELERKTGRRVRVSDLIRHQTARSLAHHLCRRNSERRGSSWRLPDLELDIDMSTGAQQGAGRRVLVSGATGALGRSLILRLLRDTDFEVSALLRSPSVARAAGWFAAGHDLHVGQARLKLIVGDLALPRFGLSAEAFDRLAGDTGAVLHLGADLDMFAEYEALEAVNVGGTREALRLACAAGARFHHLSSSAVLPLDPEHRWDETNYGAELVESLAPELLFSDGYSRSKLAAEALVWRASASGLPVTVTRIPHLVGPGIATRLLDTLHALLGACVLPEGDWIWQLAPVDAVCERLIRSLDEARSCPPLVHLTTRGVRADDIAAAFRARGRAIKRLSIPALVTVLARAQPVDSSSARILPALNQLINEYGPSAALSLSDAQLATREFLADDPLALLTDLIVKLED